MNTNTKENLIASVKTTALEYLAVINKIKLLKAKWDAVDGSSLIGNEDDLGDGITGAELKTLGANLLTAAAEFDKGMNTNTYTVLG
jgi:hypothetical protein